MSKEEIKANELLRLNILILYPKYKKACPLSIFNKAKKVTINGVDEIIKEVILFKQYSMGQGLAMEQLDFWQSVKQILESK